MAAKERGPLRALLLLTLGGVLRSLVGGLQPAHPPLLPGQPFLMLWGIPDTLCEGRPDPSAFGMVVKGGGATQKFAIFYPDTLGLYPYYDLQDQPVAGGLPQHSSLDMHLLKIEADVTAALPPPDYAGLAAIHWEEWAPQWSRNRGKREIYQQQSRQLLRQFFPDWTPAELDKWAQVDFEAAAQAVLLETLQEARNLRPQALWGFSPYPDCYNSGPGQRLANYSGCCPAAEMALNDEMLWLWKKSAALYPSLSLDKLVGGTQGARLYSSNQIREALRVAALAGTAYDLPVFPLVKSVYSSTNTFLSEADLISTVGESAAMGAAGIIIWEKFFSTKTQRGCWELADFVRGVLGPYAVNVTVAAQLCAEGLCRGRGRCVRKNPEEPAYLHLPAGSFRLSPDPNGTQDSLLALGELQHGDLEAWRRQFHCQWYEALEGTAADQVSVGSGVSRKSEKKPLLTESPMLTGSPTLILSPTLTSSPTLTGSPTLNHGAPCLLCGRPLLLLLGVLACLPACGLS